MTAWLLHMGEVLLTTCRDLLPIAAVIFGFQFLVIRKPLTNPKKIFTGLLFVLFGIVFFLEGLNMALFPLGKLMAKELTAPEFLGLAADAPRTWLNYGWVYAFAASLGLAAALAEPSLLAVAHKVENISGGAIRARGLRLAVALGVAFGLALGTFRIVTGTELYFYIVAGYALVALQTCFAPKSILALAFDMGGVTTSTVTVPLVTALGLGLATAVPGRNPVLDGFGLIAFASLSPIIAVLAYAQLAQWLAWRKSKP